MRYANIEINHLALYHNLKRAQTLAANSKILAMVKANAYGHVVSTVFLHYNMPMH